MLGLGRLGLEADPPGASFRARGCGFEKARIAPGRGVFGGEGAPDDVILANRLRPDERGAVEVLEAFSRPIEDGDAAAQTAPPLLVYADLMATGDPRNLEEARLVRERRTAMRTP